MLFKTLLLTLCCLFFFLFRLKLQKIISPICLNTLYIHTTSVFEDEKVKNKKERKNKMNKIMMFQKKMSSQKYIIYSPPVCQSLLKLIMGLVIGFMLCSILRSYLFLNHYDLCLMNRLESTMELESKYSPIVEIIDKLKSNSRAKLFVGVMTAQKFIDSRAYHIFNTWGQFCKVCIAFFTSSSYFKLTHSSLPVISLPTVDDSYPPQKKSFLMFKFMHDHFIDHFEWFLRADDDVYVNTERLEAFLSKLNSSMPYFIGQTGLGNKEEMNHLNLGANENFCMGGPGIVISSATLRLLAPHIQYCLKHLESTHEDVEIGRCIQRFVKVSCTWSYEMQTIFFHNFTGQITWSNLLKKVLKKAITLHPVRSASMLYKLHYHFLKEKHEQSRLEFIKLNRQLLHVKDVLKDNIDPELKLFLDPIDFGNSSLLGLPLQLREVDPVCEKREETLSWKLFDSHLYSGTNLNPKRRLPNHLKQAFESNLIEVLYLVNKQSQKLGRTIDYKRLYYGYYKFNPIHGINYILDLLATYRKFKGHKITIPVRKHAYALQSFSNPLIRELEIESKKNTRVNMIVPLSGRLEPFHRFMSNYIKICEQDNHINLAIILFPDVGKFENELKQTKIIIKGLIKMGLPIRFAELGGHFSRAAGLQRGASLFNSDDLLFFIDIDMQFNKKVIERVRLNTIKTKQVYFPIVFSEYSSELDDDLLNNDIKMSLNNNHGYWRQYGFGIVSLFKSDLQSVGGLNIRIQGWGKEDVDLYSKFVSSNLTILRAPDPDLIHIYHEIKCNPSLFVSQYKMCIGTKSASLASFDVMVNYINKYKLI